MTKHLKMHAASQLGDETEDDFDEIAAEDSEESDNNNQVDPRWEALRKLTENN